MFAFITISVVAVIAAAGGGVWYGLKRFIDGIDLDIGGWGI